MQVALIFYFSSAPPSAMATNCHLHHDPDMLDYAPEEEGGGCGLPAIALPPPLVSSTAQPPPSINISTLTSTIARQCRALLGVVSELQSGMVLDMGLSRPPKKQTPCFYVKRSKKAQKASSMGGSSRATLTSHRDTMEKYRDYFAQLPQYETTLMGKIGSLVANLSLLIGSLDPVTGTVSESSAQQQPFGETCFSTSNLQQAITLSTLQEFLKEYLHRDIIGVHQEEDMN